MQQVSDPWADLWSESEGRRFWSGYEDFLDAMAILNDDERTVCMEVGVIPA